MVIDPINGRPVTSIRISIVQRCNLHRFYRHHEREEDISGRSGEMRLKEYLLWLHHMTLKEL